MALLRNITFLRLIFVVAIITILLASCKGRKEVTSTASVTPKNENASNSVNPANAVLINKFSVQLGVNSKEIKNIKLYSFIDEWYAVPYKYAGCDKQGVDCSCLASNLYASVYGQKISRASRDIYTSCQELELSELKEGDFVFFKIESKNVSHVGVYLQNNKFVHASTKKGVIINDLNEAYYKKYFYKGGRLK